MQKRKEIAKMQKEYEMSQEEQDRMQSEIPEWKRQAVVLTDEKVEEEKKGLLKKLKLGVADKINKTSAAQ